MKIILENMEFYAFHGHYPEEQLTGGRYSADVIIETDDLTAIGSDRLEDAFDYTQVYDIVKKEMAVPSKLIEHVAGRILRAVKQKAGEGARVTVKISKLNPPVGGSLQSFSVVIEG
jgi:7,8-dihydroneopterin aldolase/epimerase/oxygenase